MSFGREVCLPGINKLNTAAPEMMSQVDGNAFKLLSSFPALSGIISAPCGESLDSIFKDSKKLEESMTANHNFANEMSVDVNGCIREADESQNTSPIDSMEQFKAQHFDTTEASIQRSIAHHNKMESWFECYTTTSVHEYHALIYSLYVIEKDERKMDGWTYFECFNRLQNKCRYKVRVKKQDEFYIFQEKSGHNHGIEPVGQAGSHAGLPKTVREIVDKSFSESWTMEERSKQVEAEVHRLGLPPNPRLGRQIDNRIAYLRRVNNLQETKKLHELLSGNEPNAEIFNAELLQSIVDKNGGSMTVDNTVFEKLFGQQSVASKAFLPEEDDPKCVNEKQLN